MAGQKGHLDMLNMMDPTKTESWQRLQDQFLKIRDIHRKGFFTEDPDRFKKFSIRFNPKHRNGVKSLILTVSGPFDPSCFCPCPPTSLFGILFALFSP
jgi:hypothetical protein